jgi:glyoxylase-like metal-dependent hydrolase (beta-lactamase superfamily II)
MASTNSSTGSKRMKTIRLYLNYAGYCTAKASHAVKGDPPKDIHFKALFAVIQHPEKGYVIFDTGYSTNFYKSTRSFPNKIYAWITKVFIKEKEEIKNQLIAAGISPNDIEHIIVSHFHADHIGGLKDFPNARFYCSTKAANQALEISALTGFSKGILKTLIPNDFHLRAQYLEELPCQEIDPILGKVYDIFGDSSILAFHLPGHAAGQIGIKIQTEKRTYLMVADACWDQRAITQNKLPNPIVRLFFDSWKDYQESIQKLKAYQQQYPEALLIPSHCLDSYHSLIQPQLNFDVL